MTEKTERRYSITSLRISRYNVQNPYEAEISVASVFGSEIKIKLPEERVLGLIDSVDDLILDALEAQFTAMKEDHVAGIEEQKKKALENNSGAA